MPARSASAPTRSRRALPQASRSAGSTSRSSAPARAGCTGWSRWSKSTTDEGRVGYGPVTAGDVDGAARCRHARRQAAQLGSASSTTYPWLKRQTRLTFARCGIVDPRRLDDYRGAWRLSRACARRSPSGPRRSSRRSSPPACAAAAARAFPPASSGRRSPTPSRRRNTSSATPTRATPAPSPTA